jgi:hypothetical protein
MRSPAFLLTLAAGAALAQTSAFAVLKPYAIGSDSKVFASSGDPGLRIETSISPGLSGTAFSLEDGGSHVVDFFGIWTTESDVGDDDKAPRTITATLNFALPEEDAVFSGVTFGGQITWMFVLNTHFAKVQWDGPVLISVPGDRQFSVTLSDEVFNSGLYGLGDHGATVRATITQISSRNSPIERVSDSGPTLIFLGGGALAVGGCLFIRRREQRLATQVVRR